MGWKEHTDTHGFGASLGQSYQRRAWQKARGQMTLSIEAGSKNG